MFTGYILYSDQHKVHYVGYTADLAERFLSHNHLSTKGWTVKYRPWRILMICVSLILLFFIFPEFNGFYTFDRYGFRGSFHKG